VERQKSKDNYLSTSAKSQIEKIEDKYLYPARMKIVLRSKNLTDYAMLVGKETRVQDVIEGFRFARGIKSAMILLVSNKGRRGDKGEVLIGSKTLGELGMGNGEVLEVKIDWEEEWI